MKHIKLYEENTNYNRPTTGLSHKQIIILNKSLSNTSSRWEINDDGTITAYGNFILPEDTYNNLGGLRFKEIDGGFDISLCEFKTLEGCPKIVRGDFNCNDNNLETLEHCPEEIYGNFDCSSNKLTSLEHGPTLVKGRYDIAFNKIASLKGVPKMLKSELSCRDNKLKNLVDGPVSVDVLSIFENPLESLEGFPNNYTEVKGDGFEINANFTKMHNLGMLWEYDKATPEGKKLMNSIIDIDAINKEIIKDPGGMCIFLKKYWNMPEFEELKDKIMIPEKYKENFDLVVDLDDLGL